MAFILCISVPLGYIPVSHSDTTRHNGTSCTESDICFRIDIISSKQTWNALTTQWPIMSIGLKGKARLMKWLINMYNVVFGIAQLPLFFWNPVARLRSEHLSGFVLCLCLVKAQKKKITSCWTTTMSQFISWCTFKCHLGCTKHSFTFPIILLKSSCYCKNFCFLLLIWNQGQWGVFKPNAITCLMVSSMLAPLQLPFLTEK